MAILSPLVVIALVATIAASVERYVSPPGGLQLPAATTGQGDFRIRIGNMKYPREAVDSDDVRVHIARPAHRIVSQYWSIDEYVYSVAPPQEIVAVSESAYVKSVSNVIDKVERYHPVVATDPERVIAAAPDLMLVSSTGRADYTSLARSSGVPVYRMQTALETLAQVEQSILLTGYLTGNDEEARREAARFHRAIEEAKAMHPDGAPKPRILGLGGRYSYGRGTLFDDIVTTLGGINVGAENGLKGYDSIDFEQIIGWNPEWIVAGAAPGKTAQVLESLLHDPAIALTQAARNGHIIVLEYRVFLPLSPYTAVLVKTLADSIYGSSSSGGR